MSQLIGTILTCTGVFPIRRNLGLHITNSKDAPESRRRRAVAAKPRDVIRHRADRPKMFTYVIILINR